MNCLNGTKIAYSVLLILSLTVGGGLGQLAGQVGEEPGNTPDPGSSPGQAREVVSPLFASTDVLEVTITANFKALIRDKMAEPAIKHTGTLSYQDDQGDDVTFPIKLSARGNMRKSFCSFPPIKLDLPRKKLAETLFAGQNKLKLVTHCRSSGQSGSYVNKEYLAYKLYNELTDYSFKTRLLKVNYVDSAGVKSPREAYAFVIEHKDNLAQRQSAQEMPRKGLHPQHLNRHYYGVMSVFQYMIGNTDWNAPSLHNIKLFQDKNPMTSDIIPVPYDFDACGLVKTNYSVPNDGLPITDVTQRLFRGNCLSVEEYQAVIDLFLEKREAMLGVCQNTPYLTAGERQAATKYLTQFYKSLERKKGIAYNYFMSRCRQDSEYY